MERQKTSKRKLTGRDARGGELLSSPPERRVRGAPRGRKVSPSQKSDHQQPAKPKGLMIHLGRPKSLH